MKKLSSGISPIKSGFTLIELLIVIAVLGILAVAILSAINPIEQINRSRDTGSRSDAEQLLGAVDRFYASQGFYPWKVSPTNPVSDATTWGIVSGSGWGTPDVLTKLAEAGTGELKASFTTRITGGTYNWLYKYNRGTSGDSTYICFVPKSSSFQTEAATRCTAGMPADAPSEACSGASKFSCLP